MCMVSDLQGLLERDVHTVGGQVKSHTAGLRMQLDYDALLILKIGDRAALNDRHAGSYSRKVAIEIGRTGQIVDFTLGIQPRSADVHDRYARKLELVLFLVLAEVKSAVSPGISDSNGHRTTAEPNVARRYRSVRNRVGRRRGVA